MVLGALMLIRSPFTGMGVSLSTALGVALPFAVIIVILMRLVLRSRTWKQTTGKEELVGEEAEVTETVGAGQRRRNGLRARRAVARRGSGWHQHSERRARARQKSERPYA